jgi:hypothetical protein
LNVLTFETEHQLTTEPLKIDVLIIKKNKNVAIKKNIAQIFRLCNVIEYKSPNDHVTVDDYHKTQCYGRLYAALNKADINEMSVSVVATRHPRKLLAFLKQRYMVQQTQSGIYLVIGDTCPTQVIVSEELPTEDNLWLNSLRNDLSAARLEQFTLSEKRDLPMDAYIQVLGEANAPMLEELYMRSKNNVILTEKLDAYFAEKYGASYFAEGEARGRTKGIAEGKAEGIAEGEAMGAVRGKAEGKIETLLKVLRARFKKVPKETENLIRQMTDPIALDSWAVHAATCGSMSEFTAALK